MLVRNILFSIVETNKESNMEQVEKPIGIKEAADFLGRTENSLYIMVHRGQVPYHKAARKLYFYLSELEAWIKTPQA